MSPPRPLSDDGLARRALPFLAVFGFAFAAAVLPAAMSRETMLVAAALTAIALLALGAAIPWTRLPAWSEAIVPLAFTAVVVLLRESRGGAASGYAPLAVLPVVWFGLYGTRAQVGAACAAVAVEFAGPIVLLEYPIEEWRRAVMWAVTAPFVGLAIHSLTSRQQRQSAMLLASRAELRQDHRALGEQRDFLDAILETADALVIVTDRDGRIVRFNLACERLTGYGSAEVLGELFYDLLLPAEQQVATSAMFARLAAGDFPNRYENEWLTRDGERRLIAWANTALTAEDGGVEYVIGTGTDVTARRRVERELEESERRHRTVLEAAGDVVFECDSAGCWTFLSPAWEPVTGFTVAATLGRPTHRFVHPGDVATFVERFAMLSAGLEDTVEIEHRFLNAERQEHWVASRVNAVRDGDRKLLGYSGTMRDVTARHVAEAALRSAEDRFETLFDRAPIGMVVIAPDGRFARVNDALCEMLGFSPEELRAMDPFGIVDPRDVADVAARFATLSADAPETVVTHRCRRAHGGIIWAQAHAALILGPDGQPLHILAQVQDVTARRHEERHLRRLADHDSLTGRLNRRGFDRALDDHLQTVRQDGARGALLLLDLDGFKQVNDTLGHAAGDDVLIACSDALFARLRGGDVLARLGGDEFAVLLTEQTREQAETVAQALVDVVREKTSAGAGGASAVTVSIGVALLDDRGHTAELLLARADLAMYDAKAAGRDRYAVHDTHREASGV